jgi:hypothetical protein
MPHHDPSEFPNPQLIGDSIEVPDELTLKQHDRHTWSLTYNDPQRNSLHSRWGTFKEICEDIEHFKTYGKLPQGKKMW